MGYGSTLPRASSEGYAQFHDADSSDLGRARRTVGGAEQGNATTANEERLGCNFDHSSLEDSASYTSSSDLDLPRSESDRLLHGKPNPSEVRNERRILKLVLVLGTVAFVLFLGLVFFRAGQNDRWEASRYGDDHISESGRFDSRCDDRARAPNGHQTNQQGDDGGNQNAEDADKASGIDTYEYIVVGAGPSGIIAATKLARALQQEHRDSHGSASSASLPRVLLLESGTTSQSSVTKALKVHSHKQIQAQEGVVGTKTRPYQRSMDGTTGLVWQEGTGARLNKFDIPIMWSGVSSSQGRLRAIDVSTGDDRKIFSNHHWPIQKTLLARAVGGCGVHNAMIYVRSLPTDMARWNLSSWDFDTVLNEYRDLETYVDGNWEEPPFWKKPFLNSDADTNATNLRDMPWRGRKGILRTVPAGPSIDIIAPLFVKSCITSGIGLSRVQGFNSPDPSHRVGAGYYEFNIRNGLRESVAEAFIGGENDSVRVGQNKKDVLFDDVVNDDDATTSDVDDGNRRRLKENDGEGERGIPMNLEIRVGATVTRVLTERSLTDPNRPEAVGVEYLTAEDGKVSALLRKRNQGAPKAEVILAAGAILTPQILFNSQIGPNGTVAKVPGVGKNLQDHPVVALSFRLQPNVTDSTPSVYTIGDELEDYFSSVSQLELLDETDSGSNLTKYVRERLHERLGTLGTSGFSAGAFLRSPWMPEEDKSPDIQLTVFPRVVEPHVTRSEKSRNEIKSMRASVMLVTVALLRPEARYEVRPTDSNLRASRTGIVPADDNPLFKNLHFSLPSIDLPSNRTEYLTDVDVSRLVWGIEQVRNILKSPPLSYNTVEELSPGEGRDMPKFVRDSNLPNSHWVGSAKMGKDDDPMAVLDEDLRVRAVDRLRIVDGSAIPIIANGNTHSMITVIASQAAARIIRDRKKITGGGQK